jgi:hypothetical protein
VVLETWDGWDSPGKRGDGKVDEREPITLQGTLERVLYENEEEGFVVARVALDDGNEITACGHLRRYSRDSGEARRRLG